MAGEQEEKRKVVVEGKGKAVVVEKVKGLTVEGGRRIVVCGLAVGQQVKKIVGKRNIRCCPVRLCHKIRFIGAELLFFLSNTVSPRRTWLGQGSKLMRMNEILNY